MLKEADNIVKIFRSQGLLQANMQLCMPSAALAVILSALAIARATLTDQQEDAILRKIIERYETVNSYKRAPENGLWTKRAGYDPLNPGELD